MWCGVGRLEKVNVCVFEERFILLERKVFRYKGERVLDYRVWSMSLGNIGRERVWGVFGWEFWRRCGLYEVLKLVFVLRRFIFSWDY